MTGRRRALALALIASTLALTAAESRAQPAPQAAPASVPTTAQLDQLEALVTHAEDIEAIKRLTFIFGYYRDKFFDDQLMSLFTDDAVADYAGGKYIGKTSIRRLIDGPIFKPAEAIGRQGPQDGLLNDHVLMQQVIDIAPDGRTAQARFKDWNAVGVYGKSQTRSGGAYEFDYAKESGVWKISAVAYCPRIVNPYLTNPRDITPPNDAPPAPVFYPKDPVGPDRQSNYACHSWPHPGISPPLHYPHPVDGDYIHKP